MSMPTNITKPVLLIGEGRDEEKFFSALVKHLGLIEQIQVSEYDGKDNLKGFLSALAGFSNLRRIGVTRDADNDYDAALASVNSAIRKAKLPDFIQVTSFIQPEPAKCGALETLVLQAVSSTPTWPCVEAFAICITGKITAPFSATTRDKHRLQAWLSTLSRPGLRLGEAAGAGYVPFDHPAFQPLTDFVKSLVSATEDGIPHV